MKLVCIADTHSKEKELFIPHGDVLIHAGDYSHLGRKKETNHFFDWLIAQPHTYKIVVAGNHDYYLEKMYDDFSELNLPKNIHILHNKEIIIKGKRFYGSPNTNLGKSWAFGLTVPEMENNWKKIPENTDVVITHMPPYDVLDHTRYNHIGCNYLRNVIKKIKPKYHIFGHAHENYGKVTLGETTFINATSFDNKLISKNPPIVLEL
ncbi:metallophosphatase domain-containing protein [Mesonia sp. K7]|uniref:metallophosphatase domain-containing protein n=1 Tax=Mesonia sp. K7 TaxID=2218606 RepID=UPI000DAAAD7E|nr:metallophosphatase domain-containing protein [Mesonia sp. K7]PZD78785.1 metallophosphoesterase [Mesonia sp. K7]